MSLSANTEFSVFQKVTIQVLFVIYLFCLASLNNASTIKVIIDPSDDAFGIFNFNQTQIIIAEPAKGMEEIRLQVNIIFKNSVHYET